LLAAEAKKYSFNINPTFGDNIETRHFLAKETMNIEI